MTALQVTSAVNPQLLLSIAGWFATSITLTLFNKWLIDRYGFGFPLSMTAFHFALKFLLAAAAMRAYGLKRVPAAETPAFLGYRVLPTALCTATDVAFSNLAMLYVTISIYTIIKSSVPMWVLIFSVLLGLRACSLKIIVTLMLIGVGISIANYDPGDGTDIDASVGDALRGHHLLRRALRALLPGRGLRAASADAQRGAVPSAIVHHASQHALGLACVLVASGAAGFRWACTHLMLRAPPPGRKVVGAEIPPISLHRYLLLFYQTPMGLAALLPCALAIEGADLHDYLYTRNAWERLSVLCMVSVGAGLAFVLISSELRIISLSSGLTLSVAGIFKEVLTIGFSCLLLGDKVTPQLLVGLALTVAGLTLHTLITNHEPARASEGRDYKPVKRSNQLEFGVQDSALHPHSASACE